MPMDRSRVVQFAIAAVVALGGCGFKNAGAISPTGKGGQAGGASGAGGGGIGGTSAGGTSGTGGTGGTVPIIHTLDGGGDGPASNVDANSGARNKSAMKVAPDI